MASLVSIIIPCYNAETWIEESIQSALDQTWPNKEVIVIDDGSKDGSLEKIKSFDGKIRWESGPNRGGCVARNRGVELARGDWIQFLDADDVMLPDCIAAKMATSCAANERVCCDVAAMEAGRSVVEYWNQKRYELAYIIRVGSPQTAAPLHRRKDLLGIKGFRAGLRCGQELDLHLRMAIQLGVTFVSHGKTGILTRHRPDSVSNSAYQNETMSLACGEIALNALKLIKAMKSDRSRYVDAIASRMALLGRQLHRMGSEKDAIRFVNEAKRISPRWYEGVYKSRPATILARAIGFSAFESLHAFCRMHRGKSFLFIQIPIRWLVEATN
ncbi:MAG TPA: glycosyltransferase [Verrucomicrobiae bacterium]|nr:glycosyltransferase [Verrucomicrobiae bacterium]